MAERKREDRTDGASARRRPLAPGDLRKLESGGEQPFEWAILAEHPSRAGQVLAVPADVQPFVGTGDLELPSSAAGPLVLRCGFGGWVPEAVFDESLRSGSISPREAARGEAHWNAVRSGSHRPTILQEEVDDDLEYRSWVDEVLRPGDGELLARAGEAGSLESAAVDPMATPAGGVESMRFRPRPKRLFPPRTQGLAAAALLALGTAMLWRQHLELRELRGRASAAEVRRLEGEIDELVSGRERLAADHRRELDLARREWERLAEAHHAELEEREQRLREAIRRNVVLNPVLVERVPDIGPTRGPVREVRLTKGSSHFFAIVDLDGRLELGEVIRVELLREGLNAPVWEGEVVEREDGLLFGLPTDLLPEGRCTFRFSRPGETGELLLSWELRILRESREEEGG